MPFKFPLLPGFKTYDKEIKTRYPKTPDFDIMSGVPIIRSLHIKKEDSTLCKPMFHVSAEHEEPNKPTWLVFDKQNLTFDAYFKSTVNESFGCSYNLRKCKIIYFLEDNTIKVVEPIVINSGLPQGCLIKRHKIPVPNRNENNNNNNNNNYYQLLDFNVGATVELYGKKFKIIGVDSFTRDFLKKAGVDVPENLPQPSDPYFINAEQTSRKKQQKIKAATLAKYKRVPGFDAILNFKGYWDDRDSVDGTLHVLEIRYFLVDDTMQIVEHDPDGGILRTFLKRQKVPNDRVYVKPPGFNERNDLLNVFGVNDNKNAVQWYAFDPLSSSSNVEDSRYYHWSDLHVGAEIDVYSRKIIFTNCDEFTKQYYTDCGLNNLPSIDVPQLTMKEEDKSSTHNVPVCNDDNILNKLVSRSEVEALVFKAKVKEPENSNREFILKYFLSDQSFSVFEINTQTAAGALSCRFLSKRKIPSETPNEPNVIFKLFVGRQLIIDGFQFILVDVDDRTLRFMMSYPKEFPHSDVNSIINQVLELMPTDVDTFYKKYFEGQNEILRNTFIEIMANQFPELSRHGIFVLALQYKKREKYREVSDNLFRSVLQNDLRRELFTGFDGLEANFKQRDLQDKRNGLLKHSCAFKALKSAKLPFSTEIINMLLSRFTHPETNRVAYMDVLEYLDYTTDPAPVSQYGGSAEDLHGKPDDVVVRVGELVNDLRKSSQRESLDAAAAAADVVVMTSS